MYNNQFHSTVQLLLVLIANEKNGFFQIFQKQGCQLFGCLNKVHLVYYKMRKNYAKVAE